MRYEFRIGMGFLTHNKGQSIFIISAIALGVAVQVFISALIVSVQSTIISRILGDSPHIYIEEGNVRDRLLETEDGAIVYGNFPVIRNKIVEHENIIDTLKNYEEITVIVPTVEGNALYRRQGKSTSLNIRGMDLANGDRLYNIVDRIIEGNAVVDSENILVGARVAKDYQLKVGDIMPLTLSDGTNLKVRISGIFDLENQAPNSGLVIMDLERAQRVFDKKGYVTHINFQIKDIFKAPVIAEQLQREYPDLEIVAWTRDGENILKALQSQTISSLTIQIVVMLATSMSIASVLLVTVLQKIREIGILKAMGALDRSTGYFFLIQGALIGFLGSVLGIMFGVGLIKFYVIAAKPTFEIVIEPKKIVLILVISTVAGIISGIFPARRCMKLSPIEVIKGE